MATSAPLAQLGSSTSDAVTSLDGGRGPPPHPPKPSIDPGLAAILGRSKRPLFTDEVTSTTIDSLSHDISEVPAAAVLDLLSKNIEALVRMTGDIPPTPPPTSPTVPHMRGMQAEKEDIVRSHSEKNLALLAATAAAAAATGSAKDEGIGKEKSLESQVIDGVQLRSQAATGTSGSIASSATSSGLDAREPYIVHGANAQPLNTQHAAMTRKFYSKKPPPISITAYLARIHQYCPMSTAVYLATSLYIQRLAVIERAIAVTARNVHRLLLAGLRVAMKALEDKAYSMSKMAKVGGVSEVELARLEINFCFLTGFELVCGPRVLTEQWDRLRAGSLSWTGSSNARDVMTLRLDPRPRKKV